MDSIPLPLGIQIKSDATDGPVPASVPGQAEVQRLSPVPSRWWFLWRGSNRSIAYLSPPAYSIYECTEALNG